MPRLAREAARRTAVGTTGAANRRCRPSPSGLLLAGLLLAAFAAPAAAQDSLNAGLTAVVAGTPPAAAVTAAPAVPPVASGPAAGANSTSTAPAINFTTSPAPAVASTAPVTVPPLPPVAVPLPAPTPALATPTPAVPSPVVPAVVSAPVVPAAAVPAPVPSPAASPSPAAAAPTSTPAPTPSPAVTTPAPVPAPTQEELSLVLHLSGTGLVPWSKAKGDQVLSVLVATLKAAGLAVTGSDVILVKTEAPTLSGRRLASTAGTAPPTAATTTTGTGSDSKAATVAAIPSMYTLSQTVEVQVVVGAAPGSQARVQAALVGAAKSGQLAMDLRAGGLSVSQALPMAVYVGTTEPPADLTALTATSSPVTSSPTGAPASASKSAPGSAMFIAIGASVGGAVMLTAGFLVYLRMRKSGNNTNTAGGYTYDKNSAKASPTPAIRRTGSGTSIDLEGACTPRFRQPLPITPRRAAAKASAAGTGAFHMHASSAGGGGLPSARQLPVGAQLIPGVHLLPRVPSATGSVGPRMKPNVVRTMATVQDMQEARRVAHHAQQAAEQAAMREYMKSRPPQVDDKGDTASQVARVAEQLARSASRLARSSLPRPTNFPHRSASSGASFQTSRGPSSFTAGTSGPTSEAGFSLSEASAVGTEIEPAGTAREPQSHVLHGVRSGGAPAGGGGGGRPEQVKRAAAKVQSGSPRRSGARVNGPFATRESESGSIQPASSWLGRSASAPSEARPDDAAVAAAPHDRSQLTGAWVATGGQLSMRRPTGEGEADHQATA